MSWLIVRDDLEGMRRRFHQEIGGRHAEDCNDQGEAEEETEAGLHVPPVWFVLRPE